MNLFHHSVLSWATCSVKLTNPLTCDIFSLSTLLKGYKLVKKFTNRNVEISLHTLQLSDDYEWNIPDMINEK